MNLTYDDNNQVKTYMIPGLAANNDTLTYEYRWNAIREITMPGNLKRTVTLDALRRSAGHVGRNLDLPVRQFR